MFLFRWLVFLETWDEFLGTKMSSNLLIVYQGGTTHLFFYLFIFNLIAMKCARM